MTVKELYNYAKENGIEDESIEDVESFKNLGLDTLNRGVCGTCAIRGGTDCPWKESCGICMPICLSYIPREKEKCYHDDDIYGRLHFLISYSADFNVGKFYNKETEEFDYSGMADELIKKLKQI